LLEFISEIDKGVVLHIRLTPNSRQNQILGIFDGDENQKSLKVSITQVPEKGKANKELIKFLSKNLKITKSNFEIISGHTDRNKKILISGDVEEIKIKLNSYHWEFL